MLHRLFAAGFRLRFIQKGRCRDDLTAPPHTPPGFDLGVGRDWSHSESVRGPFTSIGLYRCHVNSSQLFVGLQKPLTQIDVKSNAVGLTTFSLIGEGTTIVTLQRLANQFPADTD